jgi:hypothetical protein
MTKKLREQRRLYLRKFMHSNELNKQRVADLCHVSVYAVHSWLKPETSKSSNPTPQWAIELLEYKTFVGEAHLQRLKDNIIELQVA